MCNEIKTNRARRPGILAANACFLLAGAGLVLLNAFSYPIVEAIYAIFGGVSQPAALFFVDAVYYLPFILLPCVLLAWKSDENILRLENVPPGHGLMCVLAAVICVPVVNSVTIVWSVILESLGLTLQNTEILMESTADLALAVLAMAALPGITTCLRTVRRASSRSSSTLTFSFSSFSPRLMAST